MALEIMLAFHSLILSFLGSQKPSPLQIWLKYWQLSVDTISAIETKRVMYKVSLQNAYLHTFL